MKPIAGMAVDPVTGDWLVASDGGIFSYNAPFLGSTGNIQLNQPVVGMAASGDGVGYWLVAADSSMSHLLATPFYGSAGHIRLATRRRASRRTERRGARVSGHHPPRAEDGPADQPGEDDADGDGGRFGNSSTPRAAPERQRQRRVRDGRWRDRRRRVAGSRSAGCGPCEKIGVRMTSSTIIMITATVRCPRSDAEPEADDEPDDRLELDPQARPRS